MDTIIVENKSHNIVALTIDELKGLVLLLNIHLEELLETHNTSTARH